MINQSGNNVREQSGSRGKAIIFSGNSGDSSSSESLGSAAFSVERELDNSKPSNPSAKEQLPEWYRNLDIVSQSEVMRLCEEAGSPPSAEVLSSLKTQFEISEVKAAEVVRLFHLGKLDRSRERPKSILRSGSELPALRKRLSWSDDHGKSLTQKHEMDQWHYMHSRRNSPSQCCSIL